MVAGRERGSRSRRRRREPHRTSWTPTAATSSDCPDQGPAYALSGGPPTGGSSSGCSTEGCVRLGQAGRHGRAGSSTILPDDGRVVMPIGRRIGRWIVLSEPWPSGADDAVPHARRRRARSSTSAGARAPWRPELPDEQGDRPMTDTDLPEGVSGSSEGQRRGAPALAAEPRDAPRGPPIRRHARRDALPADPLRHPRRGRGGRGRSRSRDWCATRSSCRSPISRRGPA